MLDPNRFYAITFDCFGTLVDWETGIVSALTQLFERASVEVPPACELLHAYSRYEPVAQQGAYQPYRAVLAQVTNDIAAQYNLALALHDENILAESIANWPIFPDTCHTLAMLSEHYDLAILSNIDRDLFEPIHHRLRADDAFDFTAIITSEDTQSYKPAIGHFWQAMQALDVPGARMLHVAQSLYHDIVPAQSLGISTIWVNRNTIALDDAAHPDQAIGATPAVQLPANVSPDVEVPNLANLVELLC